MPPRQTVEPSHWHPYRYRCYFQKQQKSHRSPYALLLIERLEKIVGIAWGDYVNGKLARFRNGTLVKGGVAQDPTDAFQHPQPCAHSQTTHRSTEQTVLTGMSKTPAKSHFWTLFCRQTAYELCPRRC